MAAKIEALTPEQERRLVEWRREWFAIGSSCEPADRPRAEAAIVAMYERIGQRRPLFVWTQSPATGVLAIATLREWAKRVNDPSLRDSLGDSLGDSLRDSLWASLWASLWDSLWASLRDSLGDSLGASLFWGQHEAYWVGYYKFALDVLGVQNARGADLTLWSEISQSCCWWWPFENVCVVSERPESVSWEPNRERPRLHSLTGPALAFRDGWKVYASHGLRVPERIIERPETITVDEIDKEANAEIRRVMIERYGVDRYLKDAGAEVLHEDRDALGLPRKLVRKARGEDEPIVAVFVTNSTPEDDGTHKQYMLRVHPELRPRVGRDSNGAPLFGDPQPMTCHNAVASTFRKRGEDYHPIVET